MRSLISLFALTLYLFTFTGCLEEKVTTGTPSEDGFSSPQQMSFNGQEFGKLNETLNIAQAIHIPSTTVPDHIGRRSGIRHITQSASDTRKALLGRVLFYDTQLSATGETSCATCHEQDKAFADGKAFSDGINGAVTKRNSIALGSVPTFAPSISGYGRSGDSESVAVEGRVKFFWDERAATVKEQSEATIQDEIEMGRELHELSADLRHQEMYKILTMKAFGTTDLSPDRITLALEKFTSSISSMNTRFDELVDAENGRRVESSGLFSEMEIEGRELFNANCASCHSSNLTEPIFPVANNGLDINYADKGVGSISGEAWQNGLFKVPFLRNVALTGPYMHDGRFETLREVIDHYSEGIQDHRNLHPLLRDANNRAVRMNFTEAQKDALEAFLEMTTDNEVLQAERYSNPFRE